MSVDISGGLIFNRSFTLADLREASSHWRPELEKAAREGIDKACAKKAFEALADFFAGQTSASERHSSPEDIAFSILDETRSEILAGSSGWRLPMRLQACLFATADGRTLVWTRGSGALQRVFSEISGAQSYAYWDSSEPPEGLDEASWKLRASDWREALGESFELSPLEAGVVFELVRFSSGLDYRPQSDFLGRVRE